MVYAQNICTFIHRTAVSLISLLLDLCSPPLFSVFAYVRLLIILWKTVTNYSTVGALKIRRSIILNVFCPFFGAAMKRDKIKIENLFHLDFFFYLLYHVTQSLHKFLGRISLG